MSNLCDQMDELEVLKEIYGDRWMYHKPSKSYKIKIVGDIELWVTLNSDYPSSKPPNYELWASSLTKTQKALIDQEFDTIYKLSQGGPIIFQWIEKLKDIVQHILTEKAKRDVNPKNIKNKSISLVHESKKETKLDIIHGPIITDRKSTFQGHVCRVTTEEDVRNFVEQLLQNRKISEAKHNILAYRIIAKRMVLQDCDDDGESQAGSRMLHLLQILDVQNVAVVVTRWYGGIHLGPDRFKHINNSARQALSDAGFIKKK